MQEWITAAIGVVGTLGGTGLGYRGAVAISRREREAAQRVQMRSAFGEYLGALYASVGELRDLPDTKPPNWLVRSIDAIRGEDATWLAHRRAERWLTGDRYRELAARQVAAVARLQVLPLPPDVRAAFDAANNYTERLGENRTPALKAEWSEIHARLMTAVETLAEKP